MEEDGRGRPGGPAAPLPGLPGIAASSGLRRGPAAHVRCVCCGGAALRRPGDPSTRAGLSAPCSHGVEEAVRGCPEVPSCP